MDIIYGVPSRMCIFLQISLGITIRPRSSIWWTITVVFIYMVTSKNPQKFRQIEVFSIIGVLRLNQVRLLLIF